MKQDTLSIAEKRAAALLMKQADIAMQKLKTAADIAENVVASAKESRDRDFELQGKVSELKGIVVTGFDAVESHLKVLNGQVLDHSKLFSKILAKENIDIGVKKGLGLFWKIAGSVIAGGAGTIA